MSHDVGTESDVHTRDGGETPAHLVGAGCESRVVAIHVDGGVGLQHALLLQLLQVLDSELEDVCFLQLGDGLSVGLQSKDHEIFELVQALVDPRSPLTLQQRLHHLPILVRPRHGHL